MNIIKKIALYMKQDNSKRGNKIMELNDWSENEAIERFTSSKLYSYLEKEETKVWQYSSLMLAQLFNEERAGRLSLPEV